MENLNLLEESLLTGGKVIVTETCATIEELKQAKTTMNIISYASKRCGDIIGINGEKIGHNINISIENIFEKFISNLPLTQGEQQLILGFLQDEKSLTISQNILSQLYLLQGQNNKFLFDIYLKDTNGNLDISNFVAYLKYYIKNYSLITKNDISDIYYLKEINGSQYYSNKSNGNNSFFIIKEGEIIYYDKPLIKIQILDNGLIFGTQLNLEEQDGEESVEGIILEFGGKNFIQIYSKPGLITLTNIDFPVEGYDDLYKTKSYGKKGLIEFSKNNKDKGEEHTQVKEIFESENDDIICSRNGFITTQNIKKISEKKSENKYEYTIYAKTNNYQGPPELPTMPVGQRGNTSEYGLQHLKNIYKGPLLLKPIMPICEILSNDKEFKLVYLSDDYFMIVLDDGSSIYKFNSMNLSFSEIDGLKGIHTNKFMGHKITGINKEKLLNGKPIIVEYTDSPTQIAVFNKNTQVLNNLFIIKTGNYNTDLEKDKIKIAIGNKFFIYYYNNGKLYGLKQPYKVKNNNILIKGFMPLWFGWELKCIDSTFDEMQEHLEEIHVDKLPLIIG